MKRKNKKVAASSKNISVFGNAKDPTENDRLFVGYINNRNWIDAAKRLKEIGRKVDPAKKMDQLKRLIYQGRDLMIAFDYKQASLVYTKALALDSKNLDCLRNLAIIDQAEERYEQALRLINKALSIRQDITSIWGIKFSCLASLGKHEEIETLLEASASAGVDKAAILIEAATKIGRDNPDKALEWIELVANIPEQDPKKWLISSYGTLKQYCQFDLLKSADPLDVFKEVDPAISAYNWLYLLPLADTRESNKKLAEIQQRYYDLCIEEMSSTEDLPTLSRPNLSSSKIKIGIIGGDFCNHVVARFLIPLLENLDTDLFDIICFNTRQRIEDEMRKRFDNCCKVIEICIDYPRKAAEELRSYSLDVCIDTSGFTAYGATHVLQWRVAPLQISMIGYPGSTFTPNVDLLVGDETLIPSEEWMITESMMIVTGAATMLKPDCDMEIESNPPQAIHGFINFGVLVNPYKYSRESIELWAKVLKSTPNSQIAIVRPECRSLKFQKNIIQAFAEENIGAERIIIVNNHGKGIAYWDCYNKIDVVLDPIPMTGGVSTYDALYMGVPVVTLEGLNYHQKLSASILRSVQLEQCIAKSKEDYIRIASQLANNIELLKDFRSTLRSRFFADGGPCESVGFTRRFEKELLKQMISRGLIDQSWETRLSNCKS